ncbi:hypothetical protein Hdeb2414_s0009g00324441 [Helianthus debilis subsp. tardiflorus]
MVDYVSGTCQLEKYRERLSIEAKAFEQLKSSFQEEKVAIDKEKKSKEWGLQGLRNKLQASEELLAKEHKEWHVALKEKYEEANPRRERVEDRDLTGKDAEIAELKLRLFEAQEKNESLEIDLAAEKLKADNIEEARKAAVEARQINTFALNVAQTNYAEAQSIVDSLLSDSELMQNHGVEYVANSILNATELDQAVAGLTDAARAIGL